MFIRTKTVKGFTYYQVVRAERQGDKIRQTIVAALGKNATVKSAIGDEKRCLGRLRRERARWAEAVAPGAPSKAAAARLKRLEARICKSAVRIELLASIQEAMRIDARKRARRAKKNKGQE